MAPYVTWTGYFPFAVSRDGFAAVCLFFVLSGLVLSRKYFSDPEHPFSLSSELVPFYIRRLARIYLPFLAILIVSALFEHYFVVEHKTNPMPQGWIVDFWTQRTTWHSFFQQAVLLVRSGDDQFRLIPPDWSLTLEINISFWVPVMILVATQSTGALIFFLLTSVVLFRVPGFVLHFGMGILIAKYFSPLQRQIQKRSSGFKFGMLGIGLLLYQYRVARIHWPLPLRTPGHESWTWYVAGVGASLLILSVIGSRHLQRLLKLAPFTYLGRISYSFYLLHFLVLKCLSPYFLTIINRWVTTGTEVSYLLGLLATIGVTVLLSDVAYRWIEIPSIQLGRLLSRSAASHVQRFARYSLAPVFRAVGFKEL